jgi:hypothetical protein
MGIEFPQKITGDDQGHAIGIHQKLTLPSGTAQAELEGLGRNPAEDQEAKSYATFECPSECGH